MFGFPKISKPIGYGFKRNFIKSATFQIKFEKNNQILDFKDKLDDLFKDIMPLSKEINETKVDFKFEDKTPIILKSSNTQRGFEYKDKNGFQIINITVDALTYIVTGEYYSNFHNIYNDIRGKIISFIDISNIEELKRISIRKVNIMEFQSEDSTVACDFLPLIFNKEIVKSSLNFPNCSNINSSISNLRLLKNQYQLNLGYGMLPYNLSSRKQQALIDIDLLYSNSNIPIEELEKHFIIINDEIFNIFNWVLSDEIIESIKQ
ncbi:MAG: TIGR04255 family protein [Chitinophagales bacterium]